MEATTPEKYADVWWPWYLPWDRAHGTMLETFFIEEAAESSGMLKTQNFRPHQIHQIRICILKGALGDQHAHWSLRNHTILSYPENGPRKSQHLAVLKMDKNVVCMETQGTITVITSSFVKRFSGGSVPTYASSIVTRKVLCHHVTIILEPCIHQGVQAAA